MKLIHLSDLHLGKRVNEVSMIEDQEYILQQILRIIREENADAVMLCGDIYDKSVPSAEAVTLFDEFLSRLSRLQVQVLAISGNHDSPERLAFGSRLMEGAGIHMSPVYHGAVTPIELTDEHGAVCFWLLPFLKPAHVKRFFPEERIESYTDAVRVAIENMDLDPAKRHVLLTHQLVTGAQLCDREELSIGGSENVDAEVFDGFDYVALGHLHGPQRAGGDHIRYCGTPLKYSFSEANHHKSVTLVTLGEKGALAIETRALHPLRDLKEIRGTYQELMARSFYQDSGLPESYLHITLTDEEDVPEALGRMRVVYPYIMKLDYDNTRTRSHQNPLDQRVDARKTPLELFRQLYETQNNQPMSQQQDTFLAGLIESIWEEEA